MTTTTPTTTRGRIIYDRYQLTAQTRGWPTTTPWADLSDIEQGAWEAAASTLPDSYFPDEKPAPVVCECCKTIDFETVRNLVDVLESEHGDERDNLRCRCKVCMRVRWFERPHLEVPATVTVSAAPAKIAPETSQLPTVSQKEEVAAYGVNTPLDEATEEAMASAACAAYHQVHRFTAADSAWENQPDCCRRAFFAAARAAVHVFLNR